MGPPYSSPAFCKSDFYMSASHSKRRPTCCACMLFGDSVHDIVKGACVSSSTITLWDEPAWQVILNGWRQPERQHDAGELLLHLSSRCPNLLSLLQGTWQAMYRGSGDAWEIAEASSSAKGHALGPCWQTLLHFARRGQLMAPAGACPRGD